MRTIIIVLLGIVAGELLVMGILTAINILQNGPRRWLGQSPAGILGRETAGAKVEDIERLSKAEIMQLFYVCEAPAFEEMKGEYQTRILNAGILGFAGALYVHHVMGPGRWDGDAFYPFEKNRGWGYNRFKVKRHGGDAIVRTLKMDTYIAASEFDHKKSFHVDYSPYSKRLNRSMKDEIRKVNDELYLGIAFFSWSGGKRNPGFFVVYGKPNEWIGLDT